MSDAVTHINPKPLVSGAGGRQQGQAEGGGSPSTSAFDDLSMDGGSLRSSLTKGSPERAQSDVFCNPLWND